MTDEEKEEIKREEERIKLYEKEQELLKKDRKKEDSISGIIDIEDLEIE
jgi:hypothetical protein